MSYAEAEKAEATRAAYASDWKDFAIWCATKRAPPLPPHPGIVAAYLSHLADRGRKSSTIGRRAAAIAHRHKLAGLEPPTSAEPVRAVLRGIRRTIGAAPEGAEIAIPRGYRLRPVKAVQAWLAAAEISAGPLFRPVCSPRPRWPPRCRMPRQRRRGQARPTAPAAPWYRCRLFVPPRR